VPVNKLKGRLQSLYEVKGDTHLAGNHSNYRTEKMTVTMDKFKRPHPEVSVVFSAVDLTVSLPDTLIKQLMISVYCVDLTALCVKMT